MKGTHNSRNQRNSNFVNPSPTDNWQVYFQAQFQNLSEKVSSVSENIDKIEDEMIKRDLFEKWEQKLQENQKDLKESIENVSKNIDGKFNDIYTKLNDPESGIYSRLKELEIWKRTQSKIVWALSGAVLSLVVKILLQYFSK